MAKICSAAMAAGSRMKISIMPLLTSGVMDAGLYAIAARLHASNADPIAAPILVLML